MPCGKVLMPTPSSRTSGAASNTVQAMPRWCSISARVNPPTPPPAISTRIHAPCPDLAPSYAMIGAVAKRVRPG